MSQIHIQDLSFMYEGSYDPILEHVSVVLDTDWKLGLIGRNGRGKTTLLKLLCGEYRYEGRILASVEFDYFPFEVQDKTLDTIEIVGQIDPDYETWELMKELYSLELLDELLYRPFCTLSNGEQTKVLLAVLFLKPGRFLLIDEPTNHLDAEARRTVGKYLQKKKGFILVSHDRAFMDSCVDHILAVNKANIEVQKGNFSSWYANKQRQDQFERAENEKLRKDIRRLSAAARQAGAWADKTEAGKIGIAPDQKEKAGSRAYIGEKSRRMQQQRKNMEARRERAVQEKSKLLKNIEETEALKIRPAAYHTGRLLELQDVRIFYDGKQACGPLRFTLRQGDRIALQGRNGCGKSSVIKLIAGEPLEYTGRMDAGANLKVSYVPQDVSFLRGKLEDYVRERDIDETLFKTILRKLDFSRAQFEKPMEAFSWGQRKKVLLAASLCEQAHVYVWDEPLNYIDVFSRMQIEELILEYAPTMLFVEHDLAFMERVATEVIKF